ncbi:hypothetical protein WJX81_006768 [Elliptochloris bilobata]|uniref:Uncharacterized protein n=1 Tax=Elliptochloris bilobata TaxID=381761 RepID=A0AAW1RT39_9CHLO
MVGVICAAGRVGARGEAAALLRLVVLAAPVPQSCAERSATAAEQRRFAEVAVWALQETLDQPLSRNLSSEPQLTAFTLAQWAAGTAGPALQRAAQTEALHARATGVRLPGLS